MGEAIRVLLADDHALIRAGLRALLMAEPDLLLEGEVTTGDAARCLCAEVRPDVLLLDLRMPGPPATETVAWVRVHCPATRIVILTAHWEHAWVRGLLDLGAAGYVLKDDALDAVVKAVRVVATGGTWLSPTVLSTLVRPVNDLDLGVLSTREREMLALIVTGHSTKEIAVTLGLGVQTVSNYLSMLYVKLNVPNRAAAAVWARDHGLS